MPGKTGLNSLETQNGYEMLQLGIIIDQMLVTELDYLNHFQYYSGMHLVNTANSKNRNIMKIA